MYKILIFISLLFTAHLSFGQNVDPTAPLSSPGGVGSNSAGDNSKLILETIIHGDQLHTAVINGKLLKVGDYIGEFRLVAVNNTNVVMRSTDERLKLSIFSASVIK